MAWGKYMESKYAKNEIFRVSVFGGFNKEDVKEYILSLESEIESLKILHQKEKNELLQKLSAAEEREIKKIYCRSFDMSWRKRMPRLSP